MEKLNSYYGLAENDLAYAENCMAAGRNIGNYNIVASLCAQSGEKFLKSVVEKEFVDDPDAGPFLRTHNLRALYNKVITKFSLTVDSKNCKWLGDFYYDARYPGDNFVHVNEDDAAECLRIARQLQADAERILASVAENAAKAREELDKIRAF